MHNDKKEKENNKKKGIEQYVDFSDYGSRNPIRIYVLSHQTGKVERKTAAGLHGRTDFLYGSLIGGKAEFLSGTGGAWDRQSGVFRSADCMFRVFGICPDKEIYEKIEE